MENVVLEIVNRKKDFKALNTNEFQSLYIQKADSPPARYGKTIYIRKKYHERISQIVNIIGNRNISLYDYVDNVLTEHFKNCHEDILNSFNNRVIY